MNSDGSLNYAFVCFCFNCYAIYETQALWYYACRELLGSCRSGVGHADAKKSFFSCTFTFRVMSAYLNMCCVTRQYDHFKSIFFTVFKECFSKFILTREKMRPARHSCWQIKTSNYVSCSVVLLPQFLHVNPR